MDINQEPDKVGFQPEQGQLQNIVEIVSNLTREGGSRGDVWLTKGWLVHDGNVDAVSVELLTEAGARQYPDYPVAMLRVFEKRNEGRVEMKYDIKKEGDKLRADRYESVQTLEEEQERTDWKRKLDTLTSQEADEALRKLMTGLEKREEEHAFQRSVGNSYVSGEEVQNLIDRFSKLSTAT